MSDVQMKLMDLFLRRKKSDGYYGTVELTFQEGDVMHIRETSTMPIAALAAVVWEDLQEDDQEELKEKFRNVSSFKSSFKTPA